MSEFLSGLFPKENEIPAAYQVQPVEQREYLINGEMRIWQGPLNPVLSPVFLMTSDQPQQKLLGHTPLLTSTEALLALDAAVKAYDMGHGNVSGDPIPSRSTEEKILQKVRFLLPMPFAFSPSVHWSQPEVRMPINK